MVGFSTPLLSVLAILPIVSSSSAATSLCIDEDKMCKAWAEMGECKANPGFMHEKCRKSCRKCSPSVDGGDKCKLYMAESAIPNSGLGVFTAVDIKAGDELPVPDIVIQLNDPQHNDNLRSKKNRIENSERDVGLLDILGSYAWDAIGTRGSNDALDVRSISPGLGMLANSHPGFTNVVLGVPDVDNAGLHRSRDPGAGAISAYYNRTAAASRHVAAGMELFVQYGDDWFEGRSEEFGDTPLSYDYARADKILDRFFDLAERVDRPGFDSDLWDLIHNVLRHERIKSLLPETLDGARKVHAAGPIALHSTTEVARSIEWLQENGICLDNIHQGTSAVSEAGNGAFATRHIRAGDVIAPAPLVQIHRKALEIYHQDGTKQIEFMGEQLLKNYCFGHKDSSMLLFPYSPVVNFINHDKSSSNAFLRWSGNPNHRADWMNRSVDDLLAEKQTGLMMEFVAKRPIAAGEEIFIDYGRDWEDAWNAHKKEWKPITNADQKYVSASTFNELADVVFTLDEEKENPYPTNVMTLCHVADDLADGSKKKIRWTEPPESKWLEDAKPCHVISKDGDEEYKESIRYTARMKVGKDKSITISGIPRRAIEFVDRYYTKDQYLRGTFRAEIGIPEDIFPEAWMDLKDRVNEKCRLYVAESSIPNSGLGMYSAVEVKEGDSIFYPDVVIQQADHDWHQKERYHWNKRAGRPAKKKEKKWLLHSYYWEARNTLGIYDAEDEMMSIVPGLGMLANSHTGLVNALMTRPQVNTAGIHRSVDPGAGAFSAFHKYSYEATKDIPPGMELFVEYGDDWFEDREHKFGPIPLSDDFTDADHILKKFFHFVDKIDHPEFAKDFWSLIYDYALNHKRIKIALPAKFGDAKRVLKMGTAMASVPNAIRSPEWLAENGLCLDNIREDISTVRQAGRGAFATRSIKKGSIIAPAPLVHIHRKHLQMFAYLRDSDNSVYIGDQLLLNYCYGHRKSSMLLFPYSPVTNFINHDSETPNAYIQWSKLPNHRSEWIERSVDELMKEGNAGLILDIVAYRDIEPGEEIFLDYGKGWSDAWQSHVRNWKPKKSAASYVSASELNDRAIPFLTVEEQKEKPYPKNVMTVCYIRKRITKAPPTKGPFGDQVRWQNIKKILYFHDNSRPCQILSRDEEFNGLTGSIRPLNVTYTARVHMDQDRFIIAYGIPPSAIEFADLPETKDQYLRTAFRHEIEIPDSIFPKAWMDLVGGKELPLPSDDKCKDSEADEDYDCFDDDDDNGDETNVDDNTNVGRNDRTDEL